MLNFNFNSSTHNFWEIFQTINKFYPIGIPKTERGIYYEYPGIKEMDKIVQAKVHDARQYADSWETFLSEIESNTEYKTVSTTSGQAPSYSGIVSFPIRKGDQMTQTLELHISVSLLGDYYSIFGVHKTEVKLPIRCRQADRSWLCTEVGCDAYHLFTCSPCCEFEGFYEEIEEFIRRRFKGYKFVPFGISKLKLSGLNVRYIDDEICTIFHALFNDFMPDILAKCKKITGDKLYGYDQWKV